MDYARRMDFKDKNGQPLVKWSTQEETFEAWKECSRDRPCDYTRISYKRLRGDSPGIQWPCNDEHPDGTERLYTDGGFWADPDVCESYGKDFLTGALLEPTEYRALNPFGKAIIKVETYTTPHEWAREEYPLLLTTGWTLYHFHTRTKTARALQLDGAAPEVWAELSEPDAGRLGISEGDTVEVASPRGAVRARAARITGIREGVVFVPFHYGYWDEPGGDSPDGGRSRAANEITLTNWDPTSKQPIFKTAAARVTRIEAANGNATPAPTNTASAPVRDIGVHTAGGAAAEASETVGG